MKVIVDLCNTNVVLLEKMLADVPADRRCAQPAGLPNHPTWQLGHLAVVRLHMARMLGRQDASLPEAWLPLFSPGSTPVGDAARYPSLDELWPAFRRVHAAATEALVGASDDFLDASHGIVSLNALFPSRRHLAAGMLTTHDGMHLGQLSDWRRANGLPRVI